MNTSFTVVGLFLLGLGSTFATWAKDGHADPHWNYLEQDQWGMLEDPTYHPPFPYAECGIGQHQSPVNIDSSDAINVKSIDDLKPKYIGIPLSLTNNGHTIRINTPKGMLFFGRNAYELLQFHFHAPSEHLLNGQHFPMEIHFVNGTIDGRIAVIGVFIEAGKFNPTFQQILESAPDYPGETNTTTNNLRPAGLLPPHPQHFYTYAGSLTTPPCSEGIQWFILKETVKVSQKQIEEFTSRFYRDNARTEQNLNGRKLDAH